MTKFIRNFKNKNVLL